jgi:hypothetical protein
MLARMTAAVEQSDLGKWLSAGIYLLHRCTGVIQDD